LLRVASVHNPACSLLHRADRIGQQAIHVPFRTVALRIQERQNVAQQTRHSRSFPALPLWSKIAPSALGDVMDAIQVYPGDFGQGVAPRTASSKIRRMTKRRFKKYLARKLQSAWDESASFMPSSLANLKPVLGRFPSAVVSQL
jgi:hypothetical protein